MIPFVLYALFPLSLLSAQQSPHSLPNGYALPNGWTITPAGKSIPAHDMVLNLSMAPDGRSIVALQGGYNDEGLMVIDTATEALVQHLPLPTVWLGLAWHPDGKRLFVSGGNGTGTRRQPGFGPAWYTTPRRIFSMRRTAEPASPLAPSWYSTAPPES